MSRSRPSGCDLAPGRREDASREDDQVQGLRGQPGCDTAGLAHQAQVRSDEFDVRHVGIAKGLTDYHHVGPARRQHPGQRAADTTRAADDGDLLAPHVDASQIEAG